jgi:hypothetical protein
MGLSRREPVPPFDRRGGKRGIKNGSDSDVDKGVHKNTRSCSSCLFSQVQRLLLAAAETSSCPDPAHEPGLASVLLS